MARKCVCRGFAATVLHDPRMRLVPLAARALWLLLADGLAALPEPGVARIGGRAMSVREIAMLVSVAGTQDETQIETQIENLIETGMLNRCDDGALAMPAAPAAADRSVAASRRNGAAGGRPRRGETTEAARLRREQGGMLLPVRGGRSETQETWNETQNPETSRVGARTAAASSDSEEAKQAAAAKPVPERDEALQVADEVAGLAGMDAVRSVHEARPVLSWLAAGISRELICEVVGKVAARPSYTIPRSLGYFDRAVREAAELVRPAPAAADPDKAAERRAYLDAVEGWRAAGRPGNPPLPPASLRQEAA